MPHSCFIHESPKRLPAAQRTHTAGVVIEGRASALSTDSEQKGDEAVGPEHVVAWCGEYNRSQGRGPCCNLPAQISMVV